MAMVIILLVSQLFQGATGTSMAASALRAALITSGRLRSGGMIPQQYAGTCTTALIVFTGAIGIRRQVILSDALRTIDLS